MVVGQQHYQTVDYGLRKIEKDLLRAGSEYTVCHSERSEICEIYLQLKR